MKEFPNDGLTPHRKEASGAIFQMLLPLQIIVRERSYRGNFESPGKWMKMHRIQLQIKLNIRRRQLNFLLCGPDRL